MYEIRYTLSFETWLSNLKDVQARYRILTRIERAEDGNLGDHKSLGHNIFEMRLKYGAGYRIYYTIKNNEIIFLLNGGTKRRQASDIEKARTIMKAL